MAATRVYRDYASFRRRPERGNGISVYTLMECYDGDMARAMADNATNDGCWECTRCTGCTDCTGIHDANGLTGASWADMSA